MKCKIYTFHVRENSRKVLLQRKRLTTFCHRPGEPSPPCGHLENRHFRLPTSAFHGPLLMWTPWFPLALSIPLPSRNATQPDSPSNSPPYHPTAKCLLELARKEVGQMTLPGHPTGLNTQKRVPQLTGLGKMLHCQSSLLQGPSKYTCPVFLPQCSRTFQLRALIWGEGFIDSKLIKIDNKCPELLFHMMSCEKPWVPLT